MMWIDWLVRYSVQSVTFIYQGMPGRYIEDDA